MKLPESIEENPRRVCADCGDAGSTITLTVEDLLGNERVICGVCWRKSRGAA